MSEIIHIKTPATLVAERRIEVEQVVGMVSLQFGSLAEHDYVPDGNEARELLDVKDSIAERIFHFYEQCRGVREEERPFYNCNALGWYAVGAIADIGLYSRFRNRGVGIEPETALQPGNVYINDRRNHVVVGINRPDASLSVAGDYGPMVVAKNKDLLAFYGATALKRVIPSNAYLWL